MSIAKSLLPEFDHEMITTRAVLSAVAEDRTGFRPHPRSWTMGELSLHIANLLHWLCMTLQSTELDLDPVDGPTFTSPKFESAAATLARFEQNRDAARAALAQASDGDLMVPWTLKSRGHAIFTMPRLACVRTFVLNHVIHHRGQLTVYLRLCDIAVPSIYGPTADNPTPGG